MVISNNYLNLLTNYHPRPITSNRKLAETQKIADSLLDKPQLSQDESDYLSVLGTLAYEYETSQEIIPDLHGVELLKALLSEFSLKQKDLVPIFKTESIVSDILNNKRHLTARHIQELAEFFHVSPAVFFPG
ncbi:MAG: transcriptional regulator [Cyanobacteria bacterium P01_G01_bin.19]